MSSYLPILRPGNEPGKKVFAVLLGDSIAVPCHYDPIDGNFPCLKHQCRYAKDGICVRPAPLRHYAPAQRCIEETAYATKQELSEYMEARTAWLADSSKPKPVDPNSLKRTTIVPMTPESYRGKATAAGIAGIAEIMDKAIDDFPKPLRGVVFTLQKIKGRLEYSAWMPADPVKPLLRPFSVREVLERIFAMPIFPVDQEIVGPEERPDTIPFPKAV